MMWGSAYTRGARFQCPLALEPGPAEPLGTANCTRGRWVVNLSWVARGCMAQSRDADGVVRRGRSGSMRAALGGVVGVEWRRTGLTSRQESNCDG